MDEFQAIFLVKVFTNLVNHAQIASAMINIRLYVVRLDQ